MRYFDRLHPAVSFVCFFLIILISMLTQNPVVIGICYLTGVALCGILCGIKELLSSLSFTLPLMLIIAVTNPLFVHRGNTILFFLNDNPVTLESILYGLNASFMIMAVFYYFKCYNAVITSDKFIYLFSRISPKLTIVLTVSLCLVPKFKRKFKEISDAQKALGVFSGNSITEKVRSKLRIMSILISEALEDSVETADSMNARGWGLKGRSSYSDYRISNTDIIFSFLTIPTGIACLVLIFSNTFSFSFYPEISNPFDNNISLIIYALVCEITGVCIISEVKENILWHFYKSKI